MSYFIAGLGSMGKRRIRCLISNNIDPQTIIGFDHRLDRRKESENKYNIRTTDNFNDFKSNGCNSLTLATFTY